MKLGQLIAATAFAVSALVAQPALAGGPITTSKMPKPTLQFVSLPVDFTVTSMSFNGLIGGDTEDRPTNIAKAKVAGGPDYGPINGEFHATVYRIWGGTRTPVLVWKADKPSHLIGVSASSNGSALIEFDGKPSKTAYISDLLRLNLQDLGVRGLHGTFLGEGDTIVGTQATPVDQGYEDPLRNTVRYNPFTHQEDNFPGNADFLFPVAGSFRGILFNAETHTGSGTILWRSNGTTQEFPGFYANGMNEDLTAVTGYNGDKSGAWSLTSNGLKPIILFGRGVYVNGIYGNLIVGSNRRGAFLTDLKTGRTIDLVGTVSGLPNGYRLISADAINGAGVNGLANIMVSAARGRGYMDMIHGLLIPILN